MNQKDKEEKLTRKVKVTNVVMDGMLRNAKKHSCCCCRQERMTCFVRISLSTCVETNTQCKKSIASKKTDAQAVLFESGKLCR